MAATSGSAIRAPGMATAATATVGRVRAPRVPLGRVGRRRTLAVGAVLATLTVLYMAWFRDSSLVQVEHVQITGLSAPEAPRMRADLVAAARRMTTLDVDTGALRAALARYPIVRSVSADGQFPNSLHVTVVLNVPAAVLAAPGRSLAVAGDGTLLPGTRATSLPKIHVRALPPGRMMRDRRTLALISVAADAPAPLRRLIDAVGAAPGRGLVARMRGALTVIFGDGSRLAAKWAAVAAVLAQSSSAGASYVDVRHPEQPLAGGVALPDAPLVDAQPDPTEPAAPGVIGATAGNAPVQGQPTPALASPRTPATSINPRP